MKNNSTPNKKLNGVLLFIFYEGSEQDLCRFKYVLSKNQQGLCSIYFEEGENIDVYVDSENVKKFITNGKDRLDFFHILTHLKQNYEIENKFSEVEMGEIEAISFIRKHTREIADKYSLFENVNYKCNKKRRKNR